MSHLLTEGAAAMYRRLPSAATSAVTVPEGLGAVCPDLIRLLSPLLQPLGVEGLVVNPLCGRPLDTCQCGAPRVHGCRVLAPI